MNVYSFAVVARTRIALTKKIHPKSFIKSKISCKWGVELPDFFYPSPLMHLSSREYFTRNNLFMPTPGKSLFSPAIFAEPKFPP